MIMRRNLGPPHICVGTALGLRTSAPGLQVGRASKLLRIGKIFRLLRLMKLLRLTKITR